MTSIRGNAAAQAAFHAAVGSGSLHHAWLLAGPEGVGKASFAREAAVAMLGDAAGEGSAAPRTRSLIDAGSHPDFRVLARLPKDVEKPDQDLARSITIAQVRTLQPMFATAPSMGPRRVVLIDSIDDLERGGANALLKNLEEPPAGTIFLLVSHAPGRLLPTIRSRCRLLRFERLSEADAAAVIRDVRPDADETEVAALTNVAHGAPGRALRYAGLDIAGLDRAIEGLVANGDPDNARRVALARSLAGKAAAARYTAFLERAPGVVARTARDRTGGALADAIAAHEQIRGIAGAAAGLSLDPQATVFEIAGILAGLHLKGSSG